MSKITNYPATTTIGGGDVFLLDGAEGTRKITGQNAADGLLGLAGGAKRSELVDTRSKYVTYHNNGWHRVFSCGSAHSSSSTSPTRNRDFRCTVRRNWNSGAFETHCFQIVNSYDKFVIKPIYDLCGSRQITKARFYIIKNDPENILCCDIYYNNQNNLSNQTLITIENISDLLISNIVFETEETLEPETINTEATTGWYYEHAFKTNSWLDGPDTWPLT